MAQKDVNDKPGPQASLDIIFAKSFRLSISEMTKLLCSRAGGCHRRVPNS